MTNAQFYFAIGLPIFSILLVWLGSALINRSAIQGLGKRIDDLNKDLNKRIDDGFASVNNRLDRLETRFDRLDDEIRKDHEGRLVRLESRVFAQTA